MASEKHDVAVETLKAAPAAAGAVIAAMSLSDWVAVVTIVYVVLQAAYLLRKWVREESDWARRLRRRKTAPADDPPSDPVPLDKE